jgi:hypothetical protein
MTLYASEKGVSTEKNEILKRDEQPIEKPCKRKNPTKSKKSKNGKLRRVELPQLTCEANPIT